MNVTSSWKICDGRRSVPKKSDSGTGGGNGCAGLFGLCRNSLEWVHLHGHGHECATAPPKVRGRVVVRVRPPLPREFEADRPFTPPMPLLVCVSFAGLLCWKQAPTATRRFILTVDLWCLSRTNCHVVGLLHQLWTRRGLNFVWLGGGGPSRVVKR